MNIHYFDPEAFGNVFKTRIQYETSNAKSEGETICRGTTASLATKTSSSFSTENISYSNWPYFAWEDSIGTDNCTFVWKPSCLFSVLRGSRVLFNLSEHGGMAVSLGKESM